MNMQTYRPFALAQPFSLGLLRPFLLLRRRLAAAGDSVVVAPSGGPVVAPAQARRRGRPGAAGGALAQLAAAAAALLVVGVIFVAAAAAVVTLGPFRGRSGGGCCRDRHQRRQRRRRRLGRLIVDGGMIALLDGTFVVVGRATPRCGGASARLTFCHRRTTRRLRRRRAFSSDIVHNLVWSRICWDADCLNNGERLIHMRCFCFLIGLK